MTAPQALLSKEVYELYMPESLTFEQVSHMETEHLTEVLFVDCNIVPRDKAASLAVMAKGYATVQWLDELLGEQEADKHLDEIEAKWEAIQRSVDDRIQEQIDDYDSDECYCLAHPGALM